MAEPRDRQQRTLETKTSRRRGGQDAFGRFVITGGPCSNCGKGHNHTIKYAPASFELPDGVEVERTILKTTDHYIGLNCGCYAKFHRQVAHIVTTRAARGKKS